MNRSPGPLSPVSIGGGSEWSGISKYQNPEENSPYSPNNRGQLISPPISSGSNGTMNGNGFARGSDSPNGPSPPASIARSSNPTSLYNGSTNYSASEAGGRGRGDEKFEQVLSEHYVALKRYLAQSLRDEKGNPRPNKARDKLLRLSAVQFQELSTDVFDELLRRQAMSRRPPTAGQGDAGGAPQYLLPKDSFHPKRNQARQKLSTLPPLRFKDLATDVFFELERRFPRFAGGDISRSNAGTPVGGLPFRPDSRGGQRIRRPSETSSISAYARSESRNGSRAMNGPIPPSPGIPPNDYGRPLPKTFQSNTIVPNKSTMVEDDDDQADDNDDTDSFGLEGAAGMVKQNGVTSEEDKKRMEELEAQVTELQDKLNDMEVSLRKKDDELNTVLDGERSRASAANMEKKEFEDLRRNLENKLADAQSLNDSLQEELEKLRIDHSNAERDMRDQIDELRQNGGGMRGNNDSVLARENEELRAELQDQQQVTDDVRREAQSFLREMKMLSERSGSSWEREEQLTSQVNKLEAEVEDWRNRYARTKTQLRSIRASSLGLTIQDAAKYSKENGFTQADGLVKDVHVTKFQISIDELLRTARSDDPGRVVDYMKSVVMCVRNITNDIDESSTNGELTQEQSKLKTRVSATANNLITASKNFAAAKGLSPISLLDAAASHLTTAVVELVRTVKIRPTPAGELEDDDDGTLQPVDTTGYFPVRDNQQENIPPTFMGMRQSNVSSMYSPVNSPRASAAQRSRSNSNTKGWASQRSLSRDVNGSSGMNGINKGLPPNPMAFGIRTQDNDVEDLKIYLEDQTAVLVQTIQSLVSSIRSEAGITAITTELSAIAAVVGKVVNATETSMQSTGNVELRAQGDPIVKKLAQCKKKLIEKTEEGRRLADEGDDSARADMEWGDWTKGLPPVAFEIARETKELVQRVDAIDSGNYRGDEAF